MTTKPESRLQRSIKQELKREFPGSHWFKVHGGEFQAAGIPDLIGCVSRFYIAIEVKMPGSSKISKIQQIQITRIKEAGGIAFVATSAEEAVRLTTRYLNGKFVGTQLYRTLAGMKRRCYNKDSIIDYYKYGAKGIRVCDRWLKGAYFFWLDMGDIPVEEDSEGKLIQYSIDRINSKKNYEPSNCQWLPLSENSGKR